MDIRRRHIQDFSNASTLEDHWGYAQRVIPCTNDPGSCAYLDVVYQSHDIGVLYVGVFWASIAGCLFLWGLFRSISKDTLNRTRATLAAYTRQLTSQEILSGTTRLQLLTLLVLLGYLTAFSFAGIIYDTWITPVKKMPGVYNTRTSLGPFADRVGVLAFALTPLSVLLSSRESLLSLITGLPVHSFAFLHRWLGYVIIIQSGLHTIGWCIVELRLYQPQPQVGHDWIIQTYMIWGVVAMTLLLVLFILSLPFVIRKTGYEFFRKSHYILAMVYIGACLGHWAQLQALLVPAIVVWFADRLVRLVRSGLLHYRYGSVEALQPSFSTVQASLQHFPDARGGVIRLDLPLMEGPMSSHFFLTFPEHSIWQAHPFTPFSSDGQRQSYLIRVKKGQSSQLARLAEKRHTKVILSGPYGPSLDLEQRNVLCVAGGTGITYVLPVLFNLAKLQKGRQVMLVWAIGCAENRDWIAKELEKLSSIDVRIHVTGPSVGSDSAEDLAMQKADVRVVTEALRARPSIADIVEAFVDGTAAGATTVVASGPRSLLSDVRRAVAAINSGTRVWKGDRRFDVRLVTDDRG